MKLSAILAPLLAAKVDPEVILDAVRAWEAEHEASEEQGKEKARARWRKWKAGQTAANADQRLQTTEAVGKQLVRERARGEDNLQTTELAGNKKQKTISVHSHPERDFFEEFWSAYPRREGPNPKKPARDRFLRLVAKGADPEKLIEAARRLADEHPTPTRFVPQAQTWLSQERWDESAAPRGDEFCADDWPNTRFLLIRFREERSRDPPRAVQGGKVGYLIPAEWVALSRSNSRAAANA